MIALYAARYWKYGIMAALAIALVVCWNRWGAWKDTAYTWKAAAKAQEQSYIAAQEAAKVKAIAKVKEDRATYQALAERIDDNEQELTSLRAAADRYARANRVRSQARTAGGSAGGVPAASKGSSAESGDGPGDAAQVALDRADFDNLVDLAIRMKHVHDHGDELIAAGLAEKVE